MSEITVPAELLAFLIAAIHYNYMDAVILTTYCTALSNLVVARRCTLTRNQVEKILEAIKFIGHRPAQILLSRAVLHLDPTVTLLGLPLRSEIIDRINLRLGESTSVLTIHANGQWCDFGTVGIHTNRSTFVPYQSITNITLVDKNLTFSVKKTVTLSKLSLSDVVRLACFDPLRFLPGWAEPEDIVFEDDKLRAQVSFLGEHIKVTWKVAEDMLNRWDDLTKSDALKYLCDSANQYAYYCRCLSTEVPAPIDRAMMEQVRRYRGDRKAIYDLLNKQDRASGTPSKRMRTTSIRGLKQILGGSILFDEIKRQEGLQ
ncbi:developmentally-regulated protein [Acrasis kona]|uniref:Developmentally-regulated protein n=1 Tax=Acrasis kona TaxID=1008807 RepID=A0AAW2Z6W2_9EUKA